MIASFLGLVSGQSLIAKIIATIAIVFALTGALLTWKHFYDESLRKEGGTVREKQIEGQTNEATNKLGEIVDAATLSFDECFDNGLHWNSAESSCEGKR